MCGFPPLLTETGKGGIKASSQEACGGGPCEPFLLGLPFANRHAMCIAMVREIIKTLGALAFAATSLAALWAIFVAFNGATEARPEQPRTAADLMPMARHICKSAIEQVLHDPSRADMGDYWTWPGGVNADDTTQILVQPVIRAPNAFGGVVQSQFECRLAIIGDNETLEFIGLREV